MQPSPVGKRSRVGCALGLLLVALTLSGVVVLWAAIDHLLGRAAASLAALALVLSPLGVGHLVERAARRFGRTLAAERLALVLVPLAAIGVIADALTLHRAHTAAALAAAPERYGFAGASAEVLRRASRLLAPKAESPSPTPSALPALPVSASSAPSAALPDASPAPREEPSDGGFVEEPSCAELLPIERAHQPGARRATAIALAKARYPAGAPFIEVQNDAQLAAWFTAAPDTFEGTVSRFDAAVHEGSHLWSIARFSLGAQTYAVTEKLSVRAKRLRNFPRSEILSVHVDRDADSYAKTYLEGASGNQGMNTLLDEYNAYAHSLASRYCTRDLLAPGTRVSARDGMLTFMYYVETYLELARTRHPRDYEAILADPGHRQLILVVWDRAELWLRRSAGEANLGIADRTLRGWVYDEGRAREIGRVRDADAAPTK